MKGLKLSLIILGTAILTLGIGGMAYAFHSGGVAECSGCHSMHSAVGDGLLIAATPTETCLSCHQHAGDTGPSSYHVSTAEVDMPAGTAPLQRGPAGDFGWLKKTYTFVLRNVNTTEDGATHGHSIVAPTLGYNQDPNNATSPGGGNYNSSVLGCTSCHNMHGTYRRLSNGNIATTGAPIIGSGSYNTSKGNSTTNPIPAGQAVGVYRLLWGGDNGSGANFLGVPAAVAPSSYNRTEVSYQTRVAYGKGAGTGHTTWGGWCGTCHAEMTLGVGSHKHPVDSTLGSVIGGATGNYSMYVSSGIMNGVFSGDRLNQGPYTSLVPFIQATNDYTLLGTNAVVTNATGLGGPGSGDEVACVSCHRAHATGFPEMLRWNMEGEFITVADTNGVPTWPGTDKVGVSVGFSRGRTAAEMQGAYYDRNVLVFGAWQRGLCNKCHAKD